MGGVALPLHGVVTVLRRSFGRAEGRNVMRADKIRKIGNQIKAAEMETEERDHHERDCPIWKNFTHYNPKNLLPLILAHMF